MSTATPDPEVHLDVHDGIAEIVIDRPAVMNALSAADGGTRDQILAALAAAESEPTVGCVILRGEGSNFSGGGDLTGNARRETETEHRAFLERADTFHERLRGAEVPIVAAVQGYCLGAAVTLVDACDIVIVADDAKLGFPEGRLGLVGASGLVGTIGRQWATFLIITGEIIEARRAVELGLALTVEPVDDLLARTRDLARRISRMPREAVRHNRRTIEAVADAAGEHEARHAAHAGDTVTLTASGRATAPDGRTFRSIIDAEGMSGMKAARATQYTDPWLR